MTALASLVSIMIPIYFKITKFYLYLLVKGFKNKERFSTKTEDGRIKIIEDNYSNIEVIFGIMLFRKKS